MRNFNINIFQKTPVLLPEVDNFEARVATKADFIYLHDIIKEINLSAKERKTGIVDRTVGYLKRKINEGFAVIIIDKTAASGPGFPVWRFGITICMCPTPL